MIPIVRSLHTIILNHTIIKSSLSVSETDWLLLINISYQSSESPAVRELHVGASSLKTRGVGHELWGAHRLHLPEELHGAAGDVLAFLDTLPRREKHGLMTSLLVTNLGSWVSLRHSMNSLFWTSQALPRCMAPALRDGVPRGISSTVSSASVGSQMSLVKTILTLRHWDYL